MWEIRGARGERVFLRGRTNTSMLLSVARQRVGRRRRSRLSDWVGGFVSRMECGGCATAGSFVRWCPKPEEQERFNSACT